MTIIQFPAKGEAPLVALVSSEVKSLLGRYNVSQEALAAWLGTHQTAVSKRLRGEVEWKLWEIDRIAEAFGVHPAALMGGRPDAEVMVDRATLPIVKWWVRRQGLEPRTQ